MSSWFLTRQPVLLNHRSHQGFSRRDGDGHIPAVACVNMV
jgi:hypothetical protein